MKAVKQLSFQQLGMQGEFDALDVSAKAYTAAFRKLYYHLYTNSNASRAERIISDLSNLLLCKIVAERNHSAEAMHAFLNEEGSANELLLPVLLRSFPHLIGEDEKFYLDDKVLRYGLEELAPLSLRSAPAHVMGEAFQALMGPRLRGDKGQFFTPRSLVRAMVCVLHPPVAAKVVDPACGTGGFLVETHAFQMGEQPDVIQENVGKLIGIDKDRDLCRLAEAMLEMAAPGRSAVLNLNSLDYEALSHLSEDISPLNADVVLTNPPFGARIKVNEKSILEQFALGHKWQWDATQWRVERQVRDAQDPQILFVELCIRLLKPGGQMGIVLPEGVFGNANMGYVWDFIRSQGEITALLDCPRTTFQPSTDTKTNVLFFQKAAEAAQQPAPTRKVWMAVALQCGHDRRGRMTTSNGEPYPDDFLEIGNAFSVKEHTAKFWQHTEITNPYYLCPRYYDQSPIEELKQEAARLGAEMVALKELVKKGYVHIRKGHEVGAEAYGTGDVPFIRTSDIANYEVSIDPTRSVSEDVYERFKKQQRLKPNDILMVCDGRYRIGRTAILHEHNYRAVVQSHIRIISVAPNAPIDAIELLYLLNLPMVQHQIRNLVFIQSTLGSLGKRLGEILIPLPQRNEEWTKTIGDFFSLIQGRAEFLKKLREFEHPGYEL
ncbi:MAG TPA: N-6 DNA methylase [Anaerolineae bacterium]|nr:N-6 DNA methylase [Anaerolineae bacterium]HQI83130.1 N-6 DNA methylase [Anaerolineae bacterium]